MQQILSIVIAALFPLAGVLLVIFRRRVALYILERNRALYDSVPKLFPPPEADRDRLQLQVLEWLVAIIGLGWIVVSIGMLLDPKR
jgi:hypothetical protein